MFYVNATNKRWNAVGAKVPVISNKLCELTQMERKRDRESDREHTRYTTQLGDSVCALNERFHKQIHSELRLVVSQRRTLSPLCCV